MLTFHSKYGVRIQAEREVAALKRLERLMTDKFKHAPTYLGDFKKSLPGTEDGTKHYVLMTRLPGYTLSENKEWRRSLSRIARVERAFDLAIRLATCPCLTEWPRTNIRCARDVHGRCGVFNGSPYLRNVLWSPANEMCYIIDFERTDPDESVAHLPEACSDLGWWCNPRNGKEP